MRRITKYAAVTLGAAAATFMVVSNIGGSPLSSTPTAKASTFCEPEVPERATITPVPVEVTLPELPDLSELAGLFEDLPTCIPAPTVTLPDLTDVTLPDLTDITLPDLTDITLPTVTIPPIEIPYPDFCAPTQFSVSEGMVGDSTFCQVDD